MNDLIKSATSISTPIGLAGLFLIVFLFITKWMIEKNIFSNITSEHTAKIINNLIKTMILLIILGFLGYAINEYYKKNTLDAIESNQPRERIGSGEKWEKATTNQMKLFEDKWCAPRLRGFTSTFKIENNRLYRQIFTGPPENQTTKWLPIETYVSNRGTFKLDYIKNDWPSAFINFEGPEHAAFYIYERITNDDGKISTTDKILTLSCNRCRLEKNGSVYYCKGDEGY